MLPALCLFCMTTISRRGSWAVLVVQNLQFINCITFYAICPILPGSAIPPMRYTNLQNRIGGIAKTGRIEHIVKEVLHFGICNLKTAKTAQDGSWDALGHALATLLVCSWGFWGALGALRSGMLQPPRHFTATPACYRTLFSYLIFQAVLLHAALGSLWRLSSSLSSLSCLLGSPSGRFFPILHRFYANKSNLKTKQT